MGPAGEHRTVRPHRRARHAQDHQQGILHHSPLGFVQLVLQVSVIDFPGSNSLDYHAKTFSICGAMNNLILVILPFTGDVSDLVSQELAKVFEVGRGDFRPMIPPPTAVSRPSRADFRIFEIYLFSIFSIFFFLLWDYYNL